MTKTPDTVTTNPFRNRAFAENIKLGRSWAPDPMADIFFREQRGTRGCGDTQEEGHVKTGRDGSHELQTQEPAAQEPEGSRRVSRERVVLDFWPLHPGDNKAVLF